MENRFEGLSLENIEKELEKNYRKEPTEVLKKLQTKVKRQGLIIEALWLLMKQKGYTEDQLIEAISEVDLSEVERLNRSKEKEQEVCPNCDVPLQNTASILTRCIYCGHEVLGNPFDMNY